MGEKVAILDAGAQYGKVIDRRIRELCVESEILPMQTPASVLRNYNAIVISGGPESVYGANAPSFDPELFSLDVPVLGICYGMQLMNHVFGGKVEKKSVREDGQQEINVNLDSLLFSGLTQQQRVLLTHGDSVDAVADGFHVIARSNGLISGIEHSQRKLYGVQFHPEVDLTEHGKDILHNFLYRVAGLKGTYTPENREVLAIRSLQETVKDKNVLVLVSGGVDSTVCATLLGKALKPEQVYAVHVDNGFMRLDESSKVAAALQKQGLQLRVIDAAEQFYDATTSIKGVQTKALRDTLAPEEKRKIIGDTFMRVADQVMREIGLNPNESFLAQGTLRPDLIESASSLASGKADAIKTHHNDTELVREFRKQGRIIEPLKDYHKDEVRELGTSLGLPDELVWRQPFPGPGLAVRILCADKPYRTSEFEQVNEAVQRFGTSDISATLLPIRTVGVQGDGRTYNYAVWLSGKTSWDELFAIAHELPKQVHQVNRIVYLFGDKVTDAGGITPTFARKDVIAQLQRADDIVNQVLLEYDLVRSLSQVPVISFPAHFGIPGNRSIGIRTFITNDFMTGVPAIPGKHIPEVALETMVSRIQLEVPGISKVAYDLTAKPPGTTEWE